MPVGRTSATPCWRLGGLVQGDVEIPIQERDWATHGHAANPNYNDVVLHAVLGVSAPTTTRLQSGHRAPVLSLAPLLEAGDTMATPLRAGLWGLLEPLGYLRPETVEDLGVLLDLTGDARFLGKSSRFQGLLRKQTPEQTLYEGILEALDYHQNRQPFLTLAGRAPYLALEQASWSIPRGSWAKAIESWLMKLSGLLPPEAALAARLPRAGFGPPMSGTEWHCFRIRPANHPRRRITGVARLLSRFLEPGLVVGLDGIADTGTPQDLTAALTVKKPGGRPGLHRRPCPGPGGERSGALAPRAGRFKRRASEG